MQAIFDWTIRPDGGADLTEQVTAQGVECLYPDDVVASELPWSGKLIKVGFFGDLEHGDPWEFSLFYDVLDDGVDVLEIGPLSLLTDGTYVWPSDLAHYIVKYGVRVMPAFLCHVRKLDHQVAQEFERKLEMLEPAP